MSKKGSDSMPNSKLSYLKRLKEAFNTYNSEIEDKDLALLEKMYEYANDIDNINKQAKEELDTFIKEYSVSIEHLANIYLNNKGKTNLKHMIRKMLPIQVTKPQCRIRIIKGKENVLSNAIYQKSKVKVLCKKRNFPKAA